MRKGLLAMLLGLGVVSSAALAAAADERKLVEHTALYAFDYAYPVQARAILPLRAWLEADLARERRQLQHDAQIARDEAKVSGFPYQTYAFSRQWAVVADLPGWLSLSSGFFVFTGGAHPNHGSSGLVWDKRAGVQRKALDLFVSPAAFSRAMRAPFCAALDRERAKRRGALVDRGSGNEFDACVDPAQLTILLGSSNRRQFTRIGVLADPYVAGPYVEGDYEVTVPVTPAVIAAVRPQYRAAFALAR